MKWIIEPMSGFFTLDVTEADNCTGTGSTLRECTCTGGMVVCSVPGALVVPKT
jgi:hypothetical protein